MGPEPTPFGITSSPVRRPTENVSRSLTTNEVLHDLYPDETWWASGAYAGEQTCTVLAGKPQGHSLAGRHREE
jgi:hypothetical protein